MVEAGTSVVPFSPRTAHVHVMSQSVDSGTHVARGSPATRLPTLIATENIVSLPMIVAAKTGSTDVDKRHTSIIIASKVLKIRFESLCFIASSSFVDIFLVAHCFS